MSEGLPRLPWRLSVRSLLLLPIQLLFGFNAGHAVATTYITTPSGGPGYDASGREVAPKTSRLDQTMIDLLQPGDTLQLLADAPTGVTVYSNRLVISQKGRASSPPIVIKGIGTRTKFVRKTIETLQGCPMPEGDTEKICTDTSLVVGVLSQLRNGDEKAAGSSCCAHAASR
jgi:hypothetical protein